MNGGASKHTFIRRPLKSSPLWSAAGGEDVYEGVPIDYRGYEVNAYTFLAVLKGNKHAVRGHGSGRVIDSGPDDRVFVFYSDHGAPGVLGMPEGEADEVF